MSAAQPNPAPMPEPLDDRPLLTPLEALSGLVLALTVRRHGANLEHARRRFDEALFDAIRALPAPSPFDVPFTAAPLVERPLIAPETALERLLLAVMLNDHRPDPFGVSGRRVQGAMADALLTVTAERRSKVAVAGAVVVGGAPHEGGAGATHGATAPDAE